ncbi:MAG TPA: YbaB/EbfC family nucleoid-associated protein [Spirochaetota bacterium]|nr:YbaB/EbfC family nucleoid-associated protein [Spirochaetota bacterium]HPP03430.1 YbaB/EbfC family nucleoid-associated protein [Spirochaetota bacterium]
MNIFLDEGESVMNIFDILKDFNLEGIKTKGKDILDSLKKIQCTGEAGAGFVKVTVDGNFNIVSIDFDVNNELIKQDLIVFKDLIIAAHNSAVEKIREEIQKQIADNFFPGLF